jgi:hypothetical protein
MTLSRFLVSKLREGMEMTMLLFGLVFCVHYKDSTLWQAYESHFLTCFAFGTLFTQVPCVSGTFPFRKSKKLPNFENVAFWKKSMDDPPWKVSLFVGHEFSRKRDKKPHLKFHMKRAVLRIYRMMLSMVEFGGWMIDFRVIEISPCFGPLCSVHRCIWHRYTSELV